MPLVVEKKIRKNISDISRRMGIKEKELVDRAILLYLESVKKILDVEKEFSSWDALSDESMRKLAKRVPAGL